MNYEVKSVSPGSVFLGMRSVFSWSWLCRGHHQLLHRSEPEHPHYRVVAENHGHPPLYGRVCGGRLHRAHADRLLYNLWAGQFKRHHHSNQSATVILPSEQTARI